MKNKPPIIIEFAGLHGSGKTTTAYQLADRLTSLGYRVKTNKDFWVEVGSMGRIKRWAKLLVSPWVFIFYIWASLNVVRGKIDTFANKQKYQNKGIFGPLKDIQARNGIYLQKWKDVDFIVLDEGSIYVTIDLLWKYHLPENLFSTYIKKAKYIENTVICLFDLNIDVALDRVSERNNNSFIDNLDFNKRKKELQSIHNYYSYAYEYLENKFEICEIDIHQDSESRIHMLESYLTQKNQANNS